MLVITNLIFLPQTLELLTWISNGILEVSSWKKRLWLNLPETDVHTPHPNQTCYFYIPLAIGPTTHSVNASQKLGVTWILLSFPLATTNNHLHLMASPFSLPRCHYMTHHLLPGHRSGLPAPSLWAALLLSISLLSLCGRRCILLDPSLNVFFF